MSALDRLREILSVYVRDRLPGHIRALLLLALLAAGCWILVSWAIDNDAIIEAADTQYSRLAYSEISIKPGEKIVIGALELGPEASRREQRPGAGVERYRQIQYGGR